MKYSRRNFITRSVLRALPALMLTMLMFLSQGCSFLIRPSDTIPDKAALQTIEPEPAKTPGLEPTSAPVTTPEPQPIEFSLPGTDAAQAYMDVALCLPIENVLVEFGEPESIFGQNAYAYKAIAGGTETESALVYRFLEDGIGIEFIVSAEDGRILKKQVSSPSAFPKLIDDVSGLIAADGSPYADLRAGAGKDPYLWMSYLAPNARTDEDRYEVCLWPDKDGQFVAVVQNGVVLGSEYQPDDTVLMAAAFDGVTPRVPRYLKPDPENSNSTLGKFDPFEKFEDFELGQNKADIMDKLGAPASERTEGNLNVLTYEYSDPDFAGGKTTFEYYVTNDTQAALVMKRVQALPSGGEEIRGRYAPQMLPGMTMDDVKDFMGKPLATNKGYTQFGEETSYSYVGYYGSASAVFQTLGGEELCLRNEAVVTDALEEETLYEEYVLPVEQSKPHSDPAPTQTPSLLTPGLRTPSPTYYPRPSLPSFSFYTRPPITFIPIITPTPTPPVIIK